MKARYETTPLEALQKKFKDKVKINFAVGYEVKESYRRSDSLLNIVNEKFIKEAIEVARKSDCVIIFGGLNHNRSNDCESADRPNMKLPYGQTNLLMRF